jgi:hypothetical protein
VKQLAQELVGDGTRAPSYTEILMATNIFRMTRRLKPDAEALSQLKAMVAEAERRLDFDAARACLVSGARCSPSEMGVGSELEWKTFFEPGKFRSVLYIGSGAYPTTAFYVLERDAVVSFEGIDVSEEAVDLCSQVCAKLGYQSRAGCYLQDAFRLRPEQIKHYDAFLISSAVRPKNAIIVRLLRHKRTGAKIYAREAESHPQFYEPVEVRHPDVLTGRLARALWFRQHGATWPMPPGCEGPSLPEPTRRRDRGLAPSRHRPSVGSGH